MYICREWRDKKIKTNVTNNKRKFENYKTVLVRLFLFNSIDLIFSVIAIESHFWEYQEIPSKL